jgi:outer membrane biogenesis lipoprotein LolB
MRSVRLAVLALAAAALTGCSADITAPTSRPTGTPNFNESCRTGWLTSSGRCE